MSKERILILDGDVNTQWTLKSLLESEDYSVIAVSVIDQAFEKLAETALSGLITEYRINDSSTLSMVREFKKAFPEAYVMMLSYKEVKESEYEQIIKAGTDDFFQKPISFKKILIHLQKGLRNRLNLLVNENLSRAVSNDSEEETTTNLKFQSAT